MPRRTLIRTNQSPYHVFNRVNNREWFALPAYQVWKLFSDSCLEITWFYGARIHAAVLMSNHYHLLLSTPEADLGQVMQHFGRSMTRSYNLKSGRIGHMQNGRYKWSVINTSIYFAHAFKYIYRNPVRAGMVDRVENYAFSSLHGQIGRSYLPFPLYHPNEGAGDDLMPDAADTAFLIWLNTPHDAATTERIRRGLRRTTFQLPPSSARREIALNEYPTMTHRGHEKEADPF